MEIDQSINQLNSFIRTTWT